MTCRQQLSTCQEAVLISKYVYSRPTYLYTNIQTFDNVWLKWLKTTVPRDNSERNKHSCACSTLHSTGESCCEFFNTYIHFGVKHVNWLLVLAVPAGDLCKTKVQPATCQASAKIFYFENDWKEEDWHTFCRVFYWLDIWNISNSPNFVRSCVFHWEEHFLTAGFTGFCGLHHRRNPGIAMQQDITRRQRQRPYARLQDWRWPQQLWTFGVSNLSNLSNPCRENMKKSLVPKEFQHG